MTNTRTRYQIDATKDTRSRINAIKGELSLKTQDDVLVMLLDCYDERFVLVDGKDVQPFAIMTGIVKTDEPK